MTMRQLAAAVLCLAVLVGCSGSDDKTVAAVGGDEIATEQLDVIVKES
jgi:hypothetical protein